MEILNLSNLTIEQAVLVCLMTYDEAYDQFQDRVSLNLFTAERHRMIFESISSLKSTGMSCDTLMVCEWLKTRDKLKTIGGEEYLGQLLEKTPPVFTLLGSHLERLKELAMRRTAHTSIQAANTVLNTPDKTALDAINTAMEGLMLATQNGMDASEAVALKRGYSELLQHIEACQNRAEGELSGVATGFFELDQTLGGMGAGALFVLAARPGMGKTTLAMNIVTNVAKTSRKPCVVFSLEMPMLELTQRMASAESSIELGSVRSARIKGDDWIKFANALARTSELPIFVDDQAGKTLAGIRTQCNKIRRLHGDLGIVMVDYLQIMNDVNLSDNKTHAIGVVTGGLKALAKEHKCPVLVLSQLNRSCESRPNKRPLCSDLRDSGSIEQDADCVMFVYREEVYSKKPEDAGIAEVIIGKQRNGPTGTRRLRFEGQFSRFENLDRMPSRGDSDEW